jgi:aminoglycoside phosphotransferase (APT) family kinase protein
VCRNPATTAPLTTLATVETSGSGRGNLRRRRQRPERYRSRRVLLGGLIDFGTSGIGDPACDTTIAWTFLSGDSQRVFKERLPVDEATWTRGRGWAAWKAMIVLVRELDTDPDDADLTKNVISKILADHRDTR